MTCLDMSGHVEIIVQHCAIHKTINSCHTILDINSVFSKIEEITWEKKILWKQIKSYHDKCGHVCIKTSLHILHKHIILHRISPDMFNKIYMIASFWSYEYSRIMI